MDISIDSLEQLSDWLRELYEVLFLGASIGSLGLSAATSTIVIIGAIIAAIVSAVTAIAVYLLKAIPVYKIAKKVGCRTAWLAWMPVFPSYFRTFVLSDIAGQKPISFFDGKITVKSRVMSFWAYLGILIFGHGLVTALVGILNLIPVIGTLISPFAAILYLLPTVAAAFLEYAYLKDVLDIFKENKKSNATAAVIITVLDNLATLGFAQTIYLYTLCSRKVQPIQSEIYQD